VLIALVVTFDGFALGYEVFAGNVHASETLQTGVATMETRHGMLESRTVREAFAEGMDQMLSLAAEGLSCAKEQRRPRAAELQALITGAVIMARAASDSKVSREILNSARQRARRMIEERR
jgi:hypothetical protein